MLIPTDVPPLEHTGCIWYALTHAAHDHVDMADFVPHDACKETVAELTAAVLSEMYGEPCVGTSYHYLTTYYKDPLTGITRALGIQARC